MNLMNYHISPMNNQEKKETLEKKEPTGGALKECVLQFLGFFSLILLFYFYGLMKEIFNLNQTVDLIVTLGLFFLYLVFLYKVNSSDSESVESPETFCVGGVCTTPKNRYLFLHQMLTTVERGNYQELALENLLRWLEEIEYLQQKYGFNFEVTVGGVVVDSRDYYELVEGEGEDNESRN